LSRYQELRRRESGSGYKKINELIGYDSY
jgi:hypothetical protein